MAYIQNAIAYRMRARNDDAIMDGPSPLRVFLDSGYARMCSDTTVYDRRRRLPCQEGIEHAIVFLVEETELRFKA